jgi:hypothetical protein
VALKGELAGTGLDKVSCNVRVDELLRKPRERLRELSRKLAEDIILVFRSRKGDSTTSK